MDVVLVGAELEENLALRYLRGALTAEGFQVGQVEYDFPDDLDRAAAEIAASGARLAGLSMVFTRRGREFADLAARCRALGFRGQIVAGGHFAAFHAEELLRDVPAIDVVVIGEGERILCDLARGGDLAAIPGLVYRDGDTVRRTPPAAPEQDLDKLPWPTRRRPFDRYLGLPIVNMIGSRGCHYACGFCSIAAWHKLCGGARYRARSAADVAAEMGCLYREGVRLFNFHDDNFLGTDRDENLARAHALGEALARQGVGKLGFQIKARPDAVDPELFALLRSMGLFRVFLGIEAGTEASLKNLGRGQRLRDNERALDVLNDLDLHVAFNLLVLNPDSTLEDLAGNVAFLRRNSRNAMNFCRTEIYEGTPLARRLRKEGRLAGDYWHLDYRIADPRAELAFRLFRDAFFERNFGAHPLHYLSGQVDYEHQLRADFHGTTPALRLAAKGFVRAVNENTATHLTDVIAAVQGGDVPATFAADLAARVAADDARLHAEGQAVLRRIRDLPPPPKRAGRTGAALAASVALAIGCSPAQRDTQMIEAAPPPPPPMSGAPPNGDDPGTHMIEAAPPPPPPPRVATGVPDAGAIDAGADPSDGGAVPADAGSPVKPSKKVPAKPDAGAKPPPTPRPQTHHTEFAPYWDDE
jgi:radical SAM superfamily enzyme YgiQ (UPF0313 family)